MRKSSATPAIVLSTQTAGLGVIRALGMMGVPITAAYYHPQDMGYVSKYVQEVIRTPHPEHEEDKFVNLLLRYGERLNGSVLIPTSDETVATVARHKGALERYYTVACPGWDVAERYIDKKYTYALAQEVGVPAPDTLVPQCLEDVEVYSKTAQYPLVVKPCQSHRYWDVFNRKMVRVETPDQMVAAYQEATEAGIEVMLQELIPGDDTCGVNYNSYFTDGEPMAEFTAEKVRLAPPEFGRPRVVVSKKVPEVIDPGRRLVRAMGLTGYSCTEFKRDPRDGVYKLMEVNGRHNLSTLLSVRCGINFPWLMYQHLTDSTFPATGSSYREGVYWIDLTKDVAFSVMHRKQERFSRAQYIEPYLRPHVFAILDWKDPRPFAKRCTNLLRTLGNDLRSM